MVKKPREGDIADNDARWKLIDRALTRSMQIHPKHAGYLILELLKQVPDLESRVAALESRSTPAPKTIPKAAPKPVPVKAAAVKKASPRK